jgi:hypothetical protein
MDPMDEDTSNEAFVLSLLEGYDIDEAEAMEAELVPHAKDWRAKYLAWIDRGELPRIGPRPGASPGWPNHSP